MAERNEDKYYTELDDVLRQLALTDWATFVKLVGEEEIMKAKICVARSRGQSMMSVATKFSITKRMVQWTSEKKCVCVPYTGNISRYENKK